MNKFTLVITKQSMEDLSCTGLQDLPFRNLEIKHEKRWLKGEMIINQDWFAIANHFRTTVKRLKLTDVRMSFGEMKLLLESMDNLQTLDLKDIDMTSGVDSTLILPKLVSFSLDLQHSWKRVDYINAFKFNSGIEKMQLKLSGHGMFFQFGKFIATLPNIKNLQLEGKYVDLYLDSQCTLKLETLHTNSLDNAEHLQFLQGQIGTLKELRLKKLPVQTSCVAVMKTIYEMGLKNLYLKGFCLIKNYEPQRVETNFRFMTREFISALEILKHGGCK
jgi:hypothetical protein